MILIKYFDLCCGISVTVQINKTSQLGFWIQSETTPLLVEPPLMVCSIQCIWYSVYCIITGYMLCIYGYCVLYIWYTTLCNVYMDNTVYMRIRCIWDTVCCIVSIPYQYIWVSEYIILCTE